MFVENEFLDLIPLSRRKLKGPRGLFWEENKRGFKRNVKRIIDMHPVPQGWKRYVVASTFLFDKAIFPFDYDSWSSTNLIAATPKQGFEVMIFLNKARLEFLSLPGLVHLITHEMVHVEQAARDPARYLDCITSDFLSKKGEIEAEGRVAGLSDEFRKQWVLESILFSHDFGGWSFAKRMADFFHEEMQNLYGGGYDKGLTDEEYHAFLKSMKEKDIQDFLDYFG